MRTNDKRILLLAPWLLPVAVILPYAVLVEKFRLLVWVWHTGYAPFWSALALAGILAVVSSALLYKINKLGLLVYWMAVAMIIGHVSYLAMHEHRHALLLFIFAELSVLVVLGESMRATLRHPYYDSRRQLWEAYPKALPGMSALVYADEDAKHSAEAVRVCNLGENGCFVFTEKSELPFLPKFIEIKHNNNILLRSHVSVVEKTADRLGWGLKFFEQGRACDADKDLQDQLSVLRRSGYVNS